MLKITKDFCEEKLRDLERAIAACDASYAENVRELRKGRCDVMALADPVLGDDLGRARRLAQGCVTRMRPASGVDWGRKGNDAVVAELRRVIIEDFQEEEAK